MNDSCKKFVDYINGNAPKHVKLALVEDAVARFVLAKDRSVYHNQSFAVRFCYSKGKSSSFSNTVLSLSALEKYDHIPFFVVLVRRNADNLILLANTTFLRKISHSSQYLRQDNIVGSFNGSDIMRQAYGVSNSPEHFDYLFDAHRGLDWQDNLARLVEETNRITPQQEAFIPTEEELQKIHGSVDLAMRFVLSDDFQTVRKDLESRCSKCRNEIMIASHIENVNIRGRLIESLITADESIRAALAQNLKNAENLLPTYDSRNGLGDYVVSFNTGTAYVDIKTKIVYLSSNPKAYNIDKFLRQISDGNSLLLFFFIGIDETGVFNTALCSVYHDQLLHASIRQCLWSGRGSRGTIQFNGKAIDEILAQRNFQNNINKPASVKFIDALLEIDARDS
ncbi:MAG TPA: hypothetical protein DC009_00600 [Porphyromonadaceae bacterium]|nr:hypothetical protein [Porphyromonadaceae bacterium]